MNTALLESALAGVGAEVATEVASGPVGVIDIGSNSVRLVVYERAAPGALPLFNEKVLCGLGSELSRTGRLGADAMLRALATCRRFAGLAQAMKLCHLEVLATAAVREAENGAELVQALKRDCGLETRVLTGSEEARLGALGVAVACPGATGLVGDLGGGSLELVSLDLGQVGEGATLPLGPLRLAGRGHGSHAEARLAIDQALEGASWLDQVYGQDLYVVGGAWRALGRIRMDQIDHPVRVLHGFSPSAAEMASLAQVIAGLGRESLRQIEKVTPERRQTLPLAALVLARLIRRAKPARVVFSAYGLREGRLVELAPAAAKGEDPLLAACREEAERSARTPEALEALAAWTDPLFPDEGPAERRLRLAATYLSDNAWRVHPDYRAEHALIEVARAPYVAIDHPGRAWLALAVHHRHTGGAGGVRAARLRALLDEATAAGARVLGLALRLGHTLSGGRADVLEEARFELTAGRLVLRLADAAQALMGEIAARRFETLAKALGREARIEGAA